MFERTDDTVRFATTLLGIVALVELLLLRTGTRVLIHIPGLGRFETPIELLAEVGRLVYYLAVVLLIATLAFLMLSRVRSDSRVEVASGWLVAAFLLLALLARIEVVSSVVAGWASLAMLAVLAVILWRGVQWAPVGLFAASSVAAGWSVLGQGDGGGLSGSSVDTLILLAEVTLLLAAITSPVLIGRRPTGPSLLVGAVVGLITAGAFAAGGSTLSILVLWNIGVPGWLPGLAYALGLGALTTSLWLAFSTGAHLRGLGLVLLLAGGVGVISTYQTGLVFAGLLVLSEAHRGEATSDVAVLRDRDQALEAGVPTTVSG